MKLLYIGSNLTHCFLAEPWLSMVVEVSFLAEPWLAMVVEVKTVLYLEQCFAIVRMPRSSRKSDIDYKNVPLCMLHCWFTYAVPPSSMQRRYYHSLPIAAPFEYSKF